MGSSVEKTEKNLGGRPSIYTEELARYICFRVATNSCGLVDLCKRFPDLPCRDTINEWRWFKPEFSVMYREAKAAQMDLVMEEMDQIIDNNLSHYEDDKGNTRIDPPSVTVGVAKANNAKWFAMKLAPRLYGEGVGKLTEKAESLIEKVIDKLVEE